MKNLVSIIMPVYNVEQYVETSIKSVLNQTYKEYELIVINDGSTDNSLRILKQYESKYDKVRVYSTPNQGLAQARNEGLKHAKGQYVYFIDSDDAIVSNFLEIMIDTIKREKSDLICFNFQRCKFISESKLNTVFENKNSITVASKGAMILRAADMIHMQAWSYFMETDLLKKNKISFTEGRLFEDIDFSVKIIASSSNVTIVKTDIPLYLYRFRNDSISSRAHLKHTPKEFHDQLFLTKKAFNVMKMVDSRLAKKWLFNQLIHIYINYKNPVARIYPREFSDISKQVKIIFENHNFFISSKMNIEYLRTQYGPIDNLIRVIKGIEQRESSLINLTTNTNFMEQNDEYKDFKIV